MQRRTWSMNIFCCMGYFSAYLEGRNKNLARSGRWSEGHAAFGIPPIALHSSPDNNPYVPNRATSRSSHSFLLQFHGTLKHNIIIFVPQYLIQKFKCNFLKKGKKFWKYFKKLNLILGGMRLKWEFFPQSLFSRWSQWNDLEFSKNLFFALKKLKF